jgi:hypothetical protein
VEGKSRPGHSATFLFSHFLFVRPAVQNIEISGRKMQAMMNACVSDEQDKK